LQPSKFTAERRAMVMAAKRFGCSDETAAWHAGLNKSTLSRWLDRAERAAEGSTWHDFWVDYCRVIANVRMTAAGRALQAAADNPAMAVKVASLLEPAFRPEPPAPLETQVQRVVVRLELPSMPHRGSSTIQQLDA